jgi:hypothetical protein
MPRVEFEPATPVFEKESSCLRLRGRFYRQIYDTAFFLTLAHNLHISIAMKYETQMH